MEPMPLAAPVIEAQFEDVYDSMTVRARGGTLMKHIPGSIYTRNPDRLKLVDPIPFIPDSATYVPLEHHAVHEEIAHDIGRFIGQDALLESHFVLTSKKARDGQVLTGAKMFAMYVLDVHDGGGDQLMSLTIGATNSLDGSSRLVVGAGTNMFICDNTSFSGELVFGHRHTKNIGSAFRAQIMALVEAAEQRFIQDVRLRRRLQETPMGLETGDAILLDLYRRGALDATGGYRSSSFGLACQQWRQPSFPAFEDRNAWSLYNACTFGTTRKPNFATAMTASNKVSLAFQRMFQ